jgi:hypothetical protein
MASIDSASSVALYQLSTVGVVNSLSIDGKGMILLYWSMTVS